MLHRMARMEGSGDCGKEIHHSGRTWKTCGLPMRSTRMTSSLQASVAVAVSAVTGTPPKLRAIQMHHDVRRRDTIPPLPSCSLHPSGSSTLLLLLLLLAWHSRLLSRKCIAASAVH